MTARRSPLAIGAMVVMALACATAASASGRRSVLVVAGASGSPEHAKEQAEWVESLSAALTGPLGLPRDRVEVLAEDAAAASRSTRDNVRAAIARLQSGATVDDLVAIVLIGHGTYDGVTAKFNLVGPDLDAEEWASLLRPFPSTVVVVNTTAASYPFLAELAAPRRIVITATASPFQRYDTVFPAHFVSALTDDEADLDKDGRVSVWEAFASASGRVKRHYEQRGQLATERAVLDDTGDGQGKEAGALGPDGSLAARTFLDSGPPLPAGSGPAVSEFLARRDRLLTDLDQLKRKRAFMPSADYEAELERLILEIARVSQRIRGVS
jgi:hypothetical protein